MRNATALVSSIMFAISQAPGGCGRHCRGGDTTPPSWPAGAALTASSIASTSFRLDWPAASDDTGVVAYRVGCKGLATVLVAKVTTAQIASLSPGVSYACSVQAGDAADNWSSDGPQLTVSTLSFVAPPLDDTVITSLAASLRFLYSGSDSVQHGVQPGAIDEARASVVRGTVHDRGGAPVANATIRVQGHSELGAASSRADGTFDVVVNGGGSLHLEIVANGRLPVQRTVLVPRGRSVNAGDIVLSAADATPSTLVDPKSSSDVIVVRGPVATDSAGTRQVTLLFQPGTQATMTMPDGSNKPLDTFHVHSVEYTVSDEGPRALPGTLPPSSMYTHATGFVVDEEIAAGAVRVQFDKPVGYAVENYLGFPVGGVVPVGIYDRAKSAWEPAANGRVVAVLSGGGLDVDGSGQPAQNDQLARLGMTDGARQKLSQIYAAGQQIWWATLPHFSACDLNWPAGPDPGAGPPNMGMGPNNCGGGCDATGSQIDVENRVLHESIPVPGAPFNLHYASDRSEGFVAGRSQVVPLTDARLPPTLTRIVLRAAIAGQHVERQFPAQPNQSTTFIWDGLDGWGRRVQGRQPVTLEIGYVYPAKYQAPSDDELAFAGLSGTPIASVLQQRDYTLWQEWRGMLGVFDDAPLGLGGWGIDILHHYDPNEQVLYHGWGGRRELKQLPRIIRSVAGTSDQMVGSKDGSLATQVRFDNIAGVAVAPDGQLYLAVPSDHAIWRVDAAGIVHLFAGNDDGSDADGIAALQARVDPGSIALGPEGSVYYTDTARIRRITPDGFVRTVGGIGRVGHSGDGGPATQAEMGPIALAIAPDSSIYFVSSAVTFAAIRKIAPNGIISTLTSTVWSMLPSEGVPAKAVLVSPGGLALGPDGSIYFAEPHAPGANFPGGCVRRIGTDGIMRIVAGCTSSPADPGNGGVARAALLKRPVDVAVDRDGTVYLAEEDGFRVRRIDPSGRITAFAGTGVSGVAGDGGLAVRAQFEVPQNVALGADGALYVVDYQSGARIRKISSPDTRRPNGELLVAAEDGSEIYAFDPQGRHLRTHDFVTGIVRSSFTYDTKGRLIQVTDRSGNTTTIARDASGRASSIISADGQATQLIYGADGTLASVQDPAGRNTALTYSAGLLATRTDALGAVHRFAYDPSGRLLRDDAPEGSSVVLAEPDGGTPFDVVVSSAAGDTSRAQASDSAQEAVDPAGLRTSVVIGEDLSREVHLPGGGIVRRTPSPDPRFGMQAPANGTVTQPPDGGVVEVQESRAAQIGADGDPLKPTSFEQAIATPRGAWRVSYEPASRTRIVTSPAGRVRSLNLDASGRPTSLSLPGQQPIQVSYDARGRPATVAQGGHVWSLGYDATSHLAKVTDPLGHTAALGRDPAGHLIKLDSPDGSSVHAEYDAAGDLISLALPGGAVHRWSYSPARLARNYSFGTSSEVVLQRDPDGRLAALAFSDGGRLAIARKAGRVVRIEDPVGASSFVYDASTGALATVDDSRGIGVAFGYDGALLASTTWTGSIAGTVRRFHDGSRRLAAEAVDGAQRLDLSYDPDGLLTGLGPVTLKRDGATGWLQTVAVGSVVESVAFDGFGLEQGHTVSGPGGLLYDVQISRDSLGRTVARTEKTASGADQFSYSYDLAGRLAGVTKNGSQSASYSYDLRGNRISGPAGEVSSYNLKDQLQRSGPRSYSYSTAGALQSVTEPRGTWTFRYDLRGNLREAVRPDGKRIQYLVDGLGRRVGRSIDGSSAEGFLYRNRWQVAAWLDSSGKVKAQFVYASRAGVPDAMLMNGHIYRIVADAGGSPRLVIDATSGEVAEQIDYDDFGRILRDTAPGFQPFGFAGGLRDPDTGWLHFGSRDYDPVSGRWTATDPLGFAAGLNLYEYVHGDPLDFIDPSGGQSVAPLGPLPPAPPPPVGLVPAPVPETPGLLGEAIGLIVGAIEIMGSTVVVPLAILLTPSELGPEPWPDGRKPQDEWECGPTPQWASCSVYEDLGMIYSTVDEAMSEFSPECHARRKGEQTTSGYCGREGAHYNVTNRASRNVGSVSCCPCCNGPRREDRCSANAREP